MKNAYNVTIEGFSEFCGNKGGDVVFHSYETNKISIYTIKSYHQINLNKNLRTFDNIYFTTNAYQPTYFVR